MLLHYKILQIIVFTLLVQISWTQVHIISDEVKTLNQSWDKFYQPDSSLSLLSVGDAFKLFQAVNKSNETANELKKEIKKSEAEFYRHDPGLKVNANYLENFNPAINDDDDNLIYNRRWQAGVTWDILKNGFIDNRMTSKRLQNEIIIDSRYNVQDIDKKAYTNTWNNIIFHFNNRKVEWLDKRKKLLTELELSAHNLYLLKFLSRENYLDIIARKAEVESMYRIYADYNMIFEKVNDSLKSTRDILPVFDINYDTLIQILTAHTTKNDSAMILFNENTKLEQSIWRDISLSTTLRYNYYNLITDVPPSRSFMTLGINFGMPIPFNFKQKKALAEAKANYARYTLTHIGDEYHREVLNDCYEYRYKLKQLEGFYQKKKLLEEKLRGWNALSDIDELNFNPVQALNTLDEYFAVEIEINDLMQNLYLKYLRINSYFGVDLNDKLTRNYILPDNFDLDDAITRSVYIWSSIVEKNSTVFIREYVIYNKIENVVLSIKEDNSYKVKFNELASSLKERGKTVEAMIGDNNLINANDYLIAIDSKVSAYELKNIDAIHLDVEPHTFSDWETNKSSYLTRYLSLLQTARNWCDQNGKKLKVSIPLHYPEEVINEIFKLSDQVYFMAYENIKVDYIKRKIEPFLSYKGKIVLAASVKDFTDRGKLEQHLLELLNETKVEYYCIHDLSQLIELDEKTLEDKK